MRREILLIGCLLLFGSPTRAQDRATRVNKDREQIEASGFWIYNDVPRGSAEAKKTGKPMLVVFRCIPCEACAQLDEQVVERDPIVRTLLDRFVCVRVVHANGLDLNRFQYDFDQSWAAFLMNADGTIYGRYGTRSHQQKSEDDVSLEGFGKALEAALTLHSEHPKYQQALAGKQGKPLEFKAPEEYPSLKGRFGPQIQYGPKVVQSCIHCHQLGEAQRLVYRNAGKPIPEHLLYPYPNPKVLGLILDPKEMATVSRVTPGSSAAKDGFKAGDALLTLAGQPLLSIADIQWLLHHAGATGTLKAEVRRAGKTVPLTLTLAPGWRQRDDISWRATSWDLRRMVTGGLVLEEMPAEERQKAGLSETALALRVKYVGAWGAHAAAKQAGFQKGDVLVTVNGKSERQTESDLLASLVRQTKPGDKLPVSVLREGKKLELVLPMQ